MGLHHGPQQAHQPKRPIRELFLVLPRTLRPPVLVLATQVGSTASVAREFDFLQLRHGDSQRVTDPAQARVARSLIRIAPTPPL